MSQPLPAPPERLPAPAEPSPPGRSPLQHVLGLFTEPRRESEAILRRPGRFWMALAAAVALNLAFTGVWLQKVDPQQFIRNQIEESGRADRIPPERMELVVEQQARFMKVFGWAGGALGAPVAALVLGGLFLFIYRFFYGGTFTFTQSLSVVAWSFLVVGLVTIPLMLAVYAGKDDWNINPQSVLQANLSLLLDKETTPRALYSLAESIDVFSFWTMFLLACGYGVAVRKPTSAALWGIVIPWAVWVLGKVGLAAIMS